VQMQMMQHRLRNGQAGFGNQARPVPIR
jgi:ribosomal protein L44E